MLLARYAQIGSPRYEKLSKSSKKLDKIIEWLSPQLFAIWSIFVAGMSAGKANIDRHYFWDGSDWLIGILGILVITLIYIPLKNKLKIKELDEINWMQNSKDYFFYFLFGIILFLIGWFLKSQTFSNGISNAIVSYSSYIFAVLLVYMIKVENNIINDTRAKIIQVIVSMLLLIGSTFIGYINDDPIIATASIVTLPFIIILLFGNHVRHLERAKFYPIFIFAMFVSSREAWFLIPLFLLFFVLRSYNYLRYQEIYPTFGVSE